MKLLRHIANDQQKQAAGDLVTNAHDFIAIGDTSDVALAPVALAPALRKRNSPPQASPVGRNKLNGQPAASLRPG